MKSYTAKVTCKYKGERQSAESQEWRRQCSPRRKTKSNHLGADDLVCGYVSVLTFFEIPSNSFHILFPPTKQFSVDFYTCNWMAPKIFFSSLQERKKKYCHELYHATKMSPDFRNIKKWKLCNLESVESRVCLLHVYPSTHLEYPSCFPPSLILSILQDKAPSNSTLSWTSPSRNPEGSNYSLLLFDFQLLKSYLSNKIIMRAWNFPYYVSDATKTLYK